MKGDVSKLRENMGDIDKRLFKVEATLEGVKDNLNLLLNKSKIKF